MEGLNWLESGDLEVTGNVAKNYETWEAETVMVLANTGGEVDVVNLVRTYVDRNPWLTVREIEGQYSVIQKAISFRSSVSISIRICNKN